MHPDFDVCLHVSCGGCALLAPQAFEEILSECGFGLLVALEGPNHSLSEEDANGALAALGQQGSPGSKRGSVYSFWGCSALSWPPEWFDRALALKPPFLLGPPVIPEGPNHPLGEEDSDGALVGSRQCLLVGRSRG